MIRYNSQEAFESDYFSKISQNTLINILSMDSLSTDEVHILKVCLRWIEFELVRKNLETNFKNKRNLFKSFEHLIKFSSISSAELKEFKEIDNLLTIDEIGHLYLLHLSPDEYTSFPITCNVKRSRLKLYTLSEMIYWNDYFCVNSSITSSNTYTILMENTMVSDQMILIKEVLTNLPDVRIFAFFFNKKNLNLKSKMRIKLTNGQILFKFEEPLLLEANRTYELQIMFSEYSFGRNSNKRSESTLSANFGDKFISIKLKYKNIHCIKSIDFFIP